MWMSMTGFGRGERHGDEIAVTVEARTVNHRFLDLHMRCPGRFLAWEPRIRGIVRDSVRRGKVDLHVNVREWGKHGAGLRVNDELLRSFLGEAKRIREEHGVGGEVTLRDLLSVPDLFQTAPVEDDPAELLWPVAEGAVRDALGMLGRARAEEGDRMKRVLQESVARLEAIAQGDPVAYRGKQGTGGRTVPGTDRRAIRRGGGRSGPPPPGGGDPARPAGHHRGVRPARVPPGSGRRAVPVPRRRRGETDRFPRTGDLPRVEHRREQVGPRGGFGPRRDRQDRAGKGPRADPEHRVTRAMRHRAH